MFCRNCGKKIQDGAEFCTSCGTRQIEMTKVSNVSSGVTFHDSLLHCDGKNTGSSTPTDNIVEDLRSLESMSTLLIASLVLLFLIPIVGFVIYVYIIFKSRSLLPNIQTLFKNRGYAIYANDICDIRRKCAFLLGYLKYWLYYFVSLIPTAIIIALLSNGTKPDFGGGPLAFISMLIISVFGLVGLCLEIGFFYVFYLSVYCFVRFFKIKGYVYRLANGNSLDGVPKSSSKLALICLSLFLMLLFLIFGAMKLNAMR